MGTPDKIIYLMRGLPSCGKSHRAKRLVGDTGVILETDEFFYTQVAGDPTVYKFNQALLRKARQWNFTRFQAAVDQGITPIIVDRGNSLNDESYYYAQYGLDNGYQVSLAEPDSDWWFEIKVLLKYKPHTLLPLAMWASRLSEMSKNNPPQHGVPAEFIYHLMLAWRVDVTIEKILTLKPPK